MFGLRRQIGFVISIVTAAPFMQGQPDGTTTHEGALPHREAMGAECTCSACVQEGEEATCPFPFSLMGYSLMTEYGNQATKGQGGN